MLSNSNPELTWSLTKCYQILSRRRAAGNENDSKNNNAMVGTGQIRARTWGNVRLKNNQKNDKYSDSFSKTGISIGQYHSYVPIGPYNLIKHS